MTCVTSRNGNAARGSREIGVEGFMLKHLESAYGTGRTKAGGTWWKWKLEPAQPGALQLVAFAKVYSGLTDEEFRTVDRSIRANTLESFGPVRSVRPTLVFELGFEGIQRSRRHKSGIAVRFPRMLSLRTDKPLHEADTLQTLEALLAVPTARG